MSRRKGEVQNDGLKSLKEDVLYHLGFSNRSLDLPKEFGDIKYVCLGGSSHRMKEFAESLATKMSIKGSIPNLAEKGGRYVLYKVGSVLIANHGMGCPSLSIIMHEIFKLIHYAGCKNVIYFRLGTSGGLDVDEGTLVITTEALDTALQGQYALTILGKIVSHPTVLCSEVAEELLLLAKEVKIPAVKAKTVCANDFYEEQARLDGAFCDYTEKDKFDYFRRAIEAGAKNMEMESTCFAGLCRRAGVSAAVVCVTLLNRMKGDQISHTPEVYARLQSLPCDLMEAYLKKHGALAA